ncbi:hypothetical protein F2Q68_00036193 [Brassica cretica]|uniref:Uncharacterized protein n=1 Tax=Brassica cretica TaxID=69181 RepID=A0A8S9H0B8_BRACR|nr:hypothetical protein F2Q68_00036193 [Brassica cretica]
MIGQPMIPHSFNIHHPSQAIPQTHTSQRQANTSEIHTKPNPVPKPDLGLNVTTCKQTISNHNHNNKSMSNYDSIKLVTPYIGATLTRGSITLYDTLTQHANLGPSDFVFLLSIGNILSAYHKGQKKELSTDHGP